MIKRILLSPGHGKNTAGKRSPDSSLFEWEFNRRLVEKIASMLDKEGIEYILLDMGEEDIPLSKRAAEANAYGKNCLYVSVHGNAAGCGKWMNARGWCCYTSKGETKADPIAEIFCKEAEKLLPSVGCKVRKYSAKKYSWEENFTVLVKTLMPAILTENLFYDNHEDLKVMQSEEGLEVLAQIHVNGIKRAIKEGL